MVKNTPPGVYRLKAQIGSGMCPSALASDIELMARKNRVKGKLEVAGSGAPACTNLVLEKLEVKNGNKGY